MFILITSSCKKEDEDEITPPRDVGEQAIQDEQSLEDFLSNHFYNYEEFKNKISLNYSAIATFIKEKNPNIISKNFIGKFDKDKVLDLEEKPKNPQTDLMGVGTYFFTDKVFEYIEKTITSKLRNEKEITDVIANMAKNTEVGFQILDTKYFNISNRSDLISANYTARSLNFNKKKRH